MAAVSKYVEVGEDKDGKKTTKILEDGYISLLNIDSMKFVFDKPGDITNNVKKPGQPTISGPAANRGRIAYGAFKVRYPDNTESNSAMFTSVIIQYRSAAYSEKGSKDYAATYVNMGFPTEYIRKVIADGKKNTGINIVLDDKASEKNGHTWMNVSLERLLANEVFAFKDDEGAYDIVNLRKILGEVKSNLTAHVRLTGGVSAVSENESTHINIAAANYKLTFKPRTIYLTGDTDIEGPTLERGDTVTENVEITTSMVVSGKLAALLNKVKLAS